VFRGEGCLDVRGRKGGEGERAWCRCQHARKTNAREGKQQCRPHLEGPHHRAGDGGDVGGALVGARRDREIP